MLDRRAWIRRGLTIGLAALACEQLWRHGRDYVLADQFAAVVPGKIYRGAWQQPWPMRRIVRQYKIKTVLALAHPPDHPLAVREQAQARTLGCRWIHIPIIDHRYPGDKQSVSDRLEQAAAVLADPNNYPIYFHCHHGLNRTSMVQIAYRTKYCGWTLKEANDEIARTFGLRQVAHGPDYRHMESFYLERVLPAREALQFTGGNGGNDGRKKNHFGEDG
jgi:protein-tyrosine phosphatase